MPVFKSFSFIAYEQDVALYAELKKDKRIKYGEMSKYMRARLRDFIESHAARSATKSISLQKLKDNDGAAQMNTDIYMGVDSSGAALPLDIKQVSHNVKKIVEGGNTAAGDAVGVPDLQNSELNG